MKVPVLRPAVLLGILSLTALAARAGVTFSNVSAVQRPGTKLVDIFYDVASTETNLVSVSLAVGDGTSEVDVTNVTGAVGEGVATGAGKTIVWDAGADWGGHAAVLSYTVLADDGSGAANGANVQKFTSSGTFVPPVGVTAVEVLVVAGGGGGGSDAGGGGGAGGLIYDPSYSVTGSVAVVVGAGGTSGVQYTVPKSGQNSVFGSLVAIGGGAGAYYFANNALPGGSGGGAVVNGVGLGKAAAGTPGQGYAGSASGGGGGAGAPAPSKNGGVGLYFVQFAAAGGAPAGWFAGGGGGGGGPAGAGGLGGGADGEGGVASKNAPANTGGGGGGGYAGGPGAIGGNGGSGIVLVRYAASGGASATSCATDTRDYTLTVASAHGAPVPAAGTHTYAWRATVACGAGTESGYTCTGWSGTGSVPGSGGTDNAGSITLDAVDSSITWNWLAHATVSNVSAVQRPGTKLVDILYDLASSGGKPETVSLVVRDGGTEVCVTNLTGAVGAGITPGAGKAIVWDAGADWGGNVAVLNFTVAAGDALADGACHVQKFTADGTFVPPAGVTAVGVLVVAGGGGGGSDAGGGGGAGGLIYNPAYTVTGSVAVVVGAGGTSGVQYTVPKSGQNSAFGSLVAIGGGAGAYYYANNALPGGSGGGAVVNGAGPGRAAAGTPGQGHAGSASGGGGGAGAPAPGKNGGDGLYFVQFAAAGGSPAGWFAGGGGGGGGPAGAGGLGGGADGEGGAAPKNAPANTGGGGGGGYAGGPGAVGGNGGSGIVLVRYPATGTAGVSSCATDTRDYTLAVASAHGAPVPAAGTHTYAWHAVVTCGAGLDDDYTCTGWTGTGSVPVSGGSGSAGNITLEDVSSSISWQWQTGTNTVFCRVTFDAAGGAVAPAFMTVAQGAPCGALPVPALAGHSFRGWWSAPGAAGLLVTDATVMTNLPEQTLFARYIQNPVVTSRTPLADPAPVNEGASVMLKLTAGDGTDPDFAARGMSNVTWLVDGVRVLETRTGAPNAISSAYTLRTATNTVVGAAFRDITVTAVAYDVQGGRTDTAWTVRVNNVPAAQTVSFPSLAARTLGDEDFIPVASASTKLPVTLASSNASVAQIIDGWVHIVGAGTAVITASQPGTFDFRAAAPVSQTLTVKARLATEVPSGGGTVSGAGLYLPGAKVALAAKPSAGFTFLRWEDGSQMAVRSLVMPNANITARAWFGSTSNVPPPDVTDPGAVRAMVGVPFRLALDITSASLPAVTVAGLPPGLAYVAATKTVAGVPTAPVSNRTVTVTARNVNATPVTRTFVMTVDPLPLWAQGAFSGAAGTDALGAGSASMHVTAKGAVSGKITLRGTNFNFSAKSYTARGGDGAFSLVTTAKVGKVAWPLTVAVNVPEITDTTGTVPPTLSKAEGVLNAEGWATLYRNVWKDPGMAAVLTNRFAGYYTATLPGGREYGSGYLTFTVDRLGGVKAAGKLADGTAVSLSGTLVLDEAGRTFAVLYAAPAAYAGGGLFGLVEFLQTSEGAKVIVRPLDGEPLLWESLNPLATGDYRAGFEREPGLSGGWYDTLGNLYAYYAGTSLTMETEHAPVPELLVGANRFESACWDPDGLGLAVVTNRFGVMTGLAAPKAGVPVKVGAAYDYAAPTNALGLTVALARATGVFKGSFKAWFDYAATHTPKTLLYEGVLTPEREDMGDGVAGRGFFLWADKSQYLNPQGRPVPYAFSWSYDLKILLAEAPPQRL